MARVEFRSVVKKFGRTTVLEDFNLEIKDGEFFVLVGPSGCGKTTALRLIAGLEEVTSGDILIGERSVVGVSPKDRNVSMVFQNYALFPHMTVFDNIAYGMRVRGEPKERIHSKVSQVAESLGLTPYLKRRPSQLSGGQRQRVALGRAMVREPHVFLLDEPLSNLDAQLRGQMRVELARLHQQLGTTVVYVTHDQVEAMTLGHRIAVMRDGVVQQVGSPAEVYQRPQNRFVANFVGMMNFLPVDLSAASESSVVATDGTVFRLEGRLPKGLPDRVELGVRPEHVQIVRDDEIGVQARVGLVEQIGANSLIYLEGSWGRVTAMEPGLARYAVGEKVTIRLPAEQCHWFDPVSGERIAG